jgi:hypothetical protein
MDTIGSRICLYLLSSAFVSLVAGGIGAGRWDAACQADAEASDCDLGGLYFIWWCFVAFVACCVAAAVLELVLAQRQRSR